MNKKLYFLFLTIFLDMIGVGKSSEDETQEFVVYEHLYDDGHMQLWIRPKAMFLEEVERGGYKGPRFTYIEWK